MTSRRRVYRPSSREVENSAGVPLLGLDPMGLLKVVRVTDLGELAVAQRVRQSSVGLKAENFAWTQDTLFTPAWVVEWDTEAWYSSADGALVLPAGQYIVRALVVVPVPAATSGAHVQFLLEDVAGATPVTVRDVYVSLLNPAASTRDVGVLWWEPMALGAVKLRLRVAIGLPEDTGRVVKYGCEKIG